MAAAAAAFAGKAGGGTGQPGHARIGGGDDLPLSGLRAKSTVQMPPLQTGQPTRQVS